MTARTFAIGGELVVNRIGYGAMRLTGQPGNFGPYPDWAGGVALLRRAAELGVNFFDSAYAYGPQDCDRLLGEALGATDAVLAGKGGIDKPAPGRIVKDGSAMALRMQMDTIRANLQRDRIDLFQLHFVDPDTPLEVSVEAMNEARHVGKIRHIGLCNVGVEELERAMNVAPIAAVQNRYNMAETAAEELVDFAGEKGIAFIPYGPLGANPTQQGAKLAPGEALAFLMRRADHIVAIPGTTSVTHLEENVAAWELVDMAEAGGASL